MLTFNSQPSINGLIQRIAFELDAHIVFVIKEDGQILYHSDFSNKDELAKIAALATALLSAASSMGATEEDPNNSILRISCETATNDIYFCSIDQNHWLFSIYPHPQNPGKTRMILRNYAGLMTKISKSDSQTQEIEQKSRVKMSPLAQNDRSLFANITDDEIDKLFDEAQS
ncbi:MAG: hypothetical protein M9962_09985 [Oligoflexia bacterium]|nr:hypothetical protein [Oligoflexia bacterium]